jgi:hypothetical protein
MSLAQRFVPKGIQERAAPAVERVETFLKEFEWTWTKAAIGALILWFLAIIFIGVIPSYWLYYATSTLQWTGPPASSFWLKQLRDVVAVILFSIPTGAFLTIPYFVQNWRRKLRGAGGSRPGGGYR